MSEPMKEVTCVFVHGWAMNSAVWQPLQQNLPDWIEPRLVDLPGHGALASKPMESLAAFACSVAASISTWADRPCLWVGWSLGGLVAMQVANDFPQRVAGLMLVASSPKFVRAGDWLVAVERDVFDQFAAALEQDVDRTIKRFLMLQAIGMSDAAAAKQTVRELQSYLEAGGRASMPGLRSGLDILAGTDLRREFCALDIPLTCVLGERDTLAPAGLAAALTALNPRAKVEIIDGAAHAPFISHRDTFIRTLVHHAETLRR
jgi:pimeloyl-[acyl-carrier protein] methyl ester esterase